MASRMVVCVTEYMNNAKKDTHIDCNGKWSLGWLITIRISMVQVPDGGGLIGLPFNCNKRYHASVANLYVYIC
jgi:hypothetical protein